MIKLFRYLKNYKKQVIFGPMFKIIEAIFELIVPLVMAAIIDNGIANNDKNYILKMGLVLVVLAVVGLCSTLCCQFLASRASQGYGTDLRNEVFSHINKLSYSEIDKFGSSSLVNRMTADINQMQLAVAMLIRLVIRAPFLVIGATIMAFSIDKKISIIFLITAIIVATILYLIMSFTIPHYKKIQSELDDVTTVTKENLSGARVIRAFSKENYEKKRFAQKLEKYVGSSVSVGKISSLLNPLTYIVINGAIILILYFGEIKVNNGALTTGEITALVNYLNQILIALIVVANLILIFTKASASASRINQVLDTVPSITDEGRNLDGFNENKPIISFENVSFAYGNNKNTLENISFDIEKGEVVGVIGTTGSGKSTLVNLIPCFYAPNNGTIKINGVDTSNYPLNLLRERIGFVPQKSVLISGTIRSNLQMKKRDASEEEMYKALKISQSYEFVSKLEEGLDYKVNQGGKNFSGGQRQRLSIARALVGDPDIVILDDSSSALDFATDAALRKSLKNDLSSTVIIISQRVNSIMHADKIIVMKNGHIEGIGTHKELLDNCLEYQNIFNSQVK